MFPISAQFKRKFNSNRSVVYLVDDLRSFIGRHDADITELHDNGVAFSVDLFTGKRGLLSFCNKGSFTIDGNQLLFRFSAYTPTIFISIFLLIILYISKQPFVVLAAFIFYSVIISLITLWHCQALLDKVVYLLEHSDNAK